MKRYSGNMLLAVALPLLTLAACQTAAAIPAAAPPDVVAQALATLPVGSSAAWSGQLSRSLRGVGFHRELAYSLQLEPCHGGGITGLWQRVATALRLPERFGGCVPVTANATCDVALVQPLPAAVYADMDQLRNLAATREGSPGAFSLQLFGAADAERTEVECEPTALLLWWIAEAAPQRKPADVQLGHSAAVEQKGPAASSCSPADGCITIERAITLHARYPAPVVGDNSNHTNGSWWLSSWRSPVVSTVLPAPLVRARCSNGAETAREIWHQVQLAPHADDAERVTWNIPAGDVRHAVFVNVVTAIAYGVSAAVVLKAVFMARF